MIVTRYGEGRVFHQVLGHVWPENFGGNYKGYTMATFENAGFQRSLLRGSEWAATGTVNPRIDRSNNHAPCRHCRYRPDCSA